MWNWVVNILKLAKRIEFPCWLEMLLISPVLLYRRLRYGCAFRRLRMSQPRYAKVDPADYYRLRKYEWFAQKGTRHFYTVRKVRGYKAKRKTLIFLHKEIIEVPDGMVTDHINHDAMDNRRANLRAATHSQNACHTKKHSGVSRSKYKGIFWKKKHKKWVTRIMFEGKRMYLGCFKNEIDAAKAYDTAARKYHKEFACLNFPDEP